VKKTSFETIVASGANSALPHAVPGPREIQEGDFLTIDYGTVRMGYHSDETCTFAIRSITEKQSSVYALVKDAHDKALSAVRPGIPCKAIDGVARKVIDDGGYGQFFRTGQVMAWDSMSMNRHGYLRGQVMSSKKEWSLPLNQASISRACGA